MLSKTKRSDGSVLFDAARLLMLLLLLVALCGVLFKESQNGEVTSIELVVPVLGLIAAGILGASSAYLCSVILFVCNLPAFGAIVIASNPAAVSFTFDFPAIVYVEPTMSAALHAYMAALCVTGCVLLVLAPSEWNWSRQWRGEVQFAQANWIVLFVLSIALAVLNLRAPLITEAGYHSEEAGLTDFNAGFDGLWGMLSVGGLLCALRGFGRQSKQFRIALAIVIGSLVFFRLLRGERSTAFGAALFFAILYYSLAKSKSMAVLRIVVVMPLIMFFLIVWASVRSSAAGVGLGNAIVSGWQGLSDKLGEGSIMSFDRAPKLTWDLLETSYLYDQGVSRNGQTYINLVPQVIPTFFASAVGYERPRAEPWILADYFKHGGGVFAFAEAYWNGGLLGSIVFAVSLAVFCVWCEQWYRRLPVALSYGYFGIMTLLAQTLYVGVQSMARGIEIGVAATLLGSVMLHRISGQLKQRSMLAK